MKHTGWEERLEECPTGCSRRHGCSDEGSYPGWPLVFVRRVRAPWAGGGVAGGVVGVDGQVADEPVGRGSARGGCERSVVTEPSR